MAGLGMQLVIDLDDRGSIRKVRTLDKGFTSFKKNVRGGAADIAAGASKMQRGFAGVSRVFSRMAMIGKLALAGLAIATVIVGAKFEQSMANVASVAGASEQQLESLTNTAREWGKTTAFTASQVAEGMYSLASAGQKTIEITQSIGGVLMYAGAAATSMSKATETTVQALKMFNLRASATNRVVDIFTAGIANSMLTADRLQDSLSYVGATAYSMKMSLEETVATLGGLHNAGMMGSMAGTKLRGVLVRLAMPNAKLRELMGGLTVEADGLAAVMGQLASQNMTTGETFKAFGRIAGGGALAMMQLGQEGIEVMTEKVSIAGTAWKMYQKQMDTVSSQFKIFKSAMQENMIAVFMALRPLIMKTVKSMQEWANKIKPYIIGATKVLTEFITEKKESIKKFAAMATKALVLIGVIMGLSKTIAITKATVLGFTGAVQIMIGTFKLLASGLTILKNSWVVNWIIMHTAALAPWVLLGIAIGAALIGIGVLIVKFKSIIVSVFNKVADFFKAVGGKIQDFLSKPFDFVVDKLQWFAKKAGKVIDFLIPGFSAATSDLFKKVGGAAADGAKKLGGGIAKVGKRVGAEMAEIGDTIAVGFNADVDFVKGKFNGMKDSFTDAIDNMKGKIPGFLDWLKSLGMGTVEMNIDIGRQDTGETEEERTARIANFTETAKEIDVLADKRKAAWIETIGYNSAASKDWLAAKLEMINTEHQERLEGEAFTESQIMQMKIGKEQAIYEAKHEHQQAFVAEWMANNKIMLAGLTALGAAYDTFFMSILDKEMTGKKRREKMWESMKSSFLGTMAGMLKKYLIMKLKNILLGQAMEQAAQIKTRLAYAKLGAIKAYQAFAGVPLIGPILGAAAAAAAFTFLMAFHKGGLVDDSNSRESGLAGKLKSNEVATVLEHKEYVIQRSSAESIGTPALDYINRTGQLPPAGAGNSSMENVSVSTPNAVKYTGLPPVTVNNSPSLLSRLTAAAAGLIRKACGIG